MTEAREYRKIPVTIKAMQMPMYTEIPSNMRHSLTLMGEISLWIKKSSGVQPTFGLDRKNKPYLYIVTLEGTMMASADDFIIKGVSGEFYPCKPDIFAKTYEEVING